MGGDSSAGMAGDPLGGEWGSCRGFRVHGRRDPFELQTTPLCRCLQWVRRGSCHQTSGGVTRNRPRPLLVSLFAARRGEEFRAVSSWTCRAPGVTGRWQPSVRRHCRARTANSRVQRLPRRQSWEGRGHEDPAQKVTATRWGGRRGGKCLVQVFSGWPRVLHAHRRLRGANEQEASCGPTWLRCM